MSENAPGTTVPEGIRCSDAEREEVRAALYAAAGEGRLTMDEVEERLGRLEQIRYRHELAAMTADLPAPEPSAAPKGWRQILSAAAAALAAEVAVLRGRTPEPTPGRRRLLVIVTVLIGLLITAAIAASAVHGFGPDGFEAHGPAALEHPHGG
ncbi:DUF1707 domain-containing protein [Amycolatopsis sp. cg9]|uniref:DUF1707 SHOCT-like domain-containing protein n=1 Tax=Amycolatopsis sp. cg9 TaxID=3238801 RepID=UPI0035263F11